MKNNFKYVYFGLLTLLLVSVSCTKFEEFTGSTLAPKVSLDLTLLAFGEDSVVAVAVNPSNGYITVGIVPTADLEDYDSVAFFQQNVSGVAFVTKQATKDEPVSFVFKELEPFTAYTIIGVSSNPDGVVGAPVILSATTSDFQAPVIVSTTPEDYLTSGSALNLSTDCSITLVFNEPVVVTPDSIFFYLYYDDLVLSGADLNITSNGKEVTISSNVLARNREIVCLNWGEGAFKDLSGNKIAAQESGVIGGSITGWCWRTELKKFLPVDVTPADGDSVVAADFQRIKLVYADKVGGFYPTYASGAVAKMSVTYSSPNGDVLTKLVPNANVTWSADTAFIVLPLAPVAGQKVKFMMNESTLKIGITNPTGAFSATWPIK
jgi:hypothetical protein